MGKAFELLKFVANSENELGISELSHHLGFSKSTTHGLVQALVQTGALDQSAARKKVVLGPTIMELVFKGGSFLKILSLIQPRLDEVCQNIDETVFLGALSMAGSTIMAKAEPTKPFKISSAVGTPIPLFAGVAGKIFMARLNDSEVVKTIRKKGGLPQFTRNSIVKEEEYLSELSKVRKQGYALDNQEYLTGIKAIATNLGNIRGFPLGIWIVGYAGSMTEEKMPIFIKEIQKSTKKIMAEFKL
ncbi:MAG: IclR family transcriptional regulator [Proteobacteria bacterium]|nr:IclR family transcriptional regulator [Pseudomonadota bacterium]